MILSRLKDIKAKIEQKSINNIRLPFEGPFKDKYAGRSPERILCLYSVRLVIAFFVFFGWVDAFLFSFLHCVHLLEIVPVVCFAPCTLVSVINQISEYDGNQEFFFFFLPTNLNAYLVQWFMMMIRRLYLSYNRLSATSHHFEFTPTRWIPSLPTSCLFSSFLLPPFCLLSQPSHRSSSLF